MINTSKTVIASKKLYLLQNSIALSKTKERAAEIINEIEALLLAEKENVIATIPIVKLDSRIGWEASMEYQCDEAALNWKLRQLEHEFKITLPNFRKSNSL
jgi:hypothetical protein